MRFLLADSFTGALAHLPAQDSKAVKTTVVDLQIDPTGKGLSFHRIGQSKDPNFWSVRVSRDLRLIVHKTEDSLLIAYVDHHDKAYAWAERRRIEAHPSTGAIQIVEVRERVEETAPAVPNAPAIGAAAAGDRHPFASLGDGALLSAGVPVDWLDDVRAATEDGFFEVASHLPTEAAEALLQYAAAGTLPTPPLPVESDPYTHPDAQRRIRLIVDEEELRQALDYPWERWGVFLHPSQRAIVERRFAGPARVSGSAGTGKTVVALHRAVGLARANPQARVLLTTFSAPLARLLAAKLRVLAPEAGGIVPRITVSDWHTAADELFQLKHGRRPRIVSTDALRTMIEEVATAAGVRGFTSRFLLSEWTNVVDAWGINGLQRYASVPRLGRRTPLGPRQRERLWSVFEPVAAALCEEGIFTRAEVCRDVAGHYATRESKPFDHIVVDEAQDLGPAELAFLAAIAPPADDALFFAGDSGQRIFQHSFSWKALGIELRGRSATLKVCYRTSRQIRSVADRLLPGALRDPDGNEDERSGTVSVFDGPQPSIAVLADARREIETVADFIRNAVADCIRPDEIGMFVRSPNEIGRARAAAEGAGIGDQVAISVMHLAKGLEFRAVVVMACDQDVLPLESRIAEAADEGELDDIYETERQLLYVACTRARDRLLVTGVAPGSEFLKDL
jgi:UvrD-like helicase C-terminal domain/AAA domain